MQERRAFERFSVEGDALLKEQVNSVELLKGDLDDISFGGFSLFSKEKIEVDRVVYFKLKVYLGDETIEGKGKIRYTYQPKIFEDRICSTGIEFLEVNKDIITYLINRIQTELLNKKRDKMQARRLDFMPY